MTRGARLGVGRVRLCSLARVLSTRAGPSSAAGMCGQERAGPGARQGWQPAGMAGRLRALKAVGTTLELVRGTRETGRAQHLCHSLPVMSHPQHVTMLGVPRGMAPSQAAAGHPSMRDKEWAGGDEGDKEPVRGHSEKFWAETKGTQHFSLTLLSLLCHSSQSSSNFSLHR